MDRSILSSIVTEILHRKFCSKLIRHPIVSSLSCKSDSKITLEKIGQLVSLVFMLKNIIFD